MTQETKLQAYNKVGNVLAVSLKILELFLNGYFKVGVCIGFCVVAEKTK